MAPDCVQYRQDALKANRTWLPVADSWEIRGQNGQGQSERAAVIHDACIRPGKFFKSCLCHTRMWSYALTAAYCILNELVMYHQLPKKE